MAEGIAVAARNTRVELRCCWEAAGFGSEIIIIIIIIFVLKCINRDVSGSSPSINRIPFFPLVFARLRC